MMEAYAKFHNELEKKRSTRNRGDIATILVAVENSASGLELSTRDAIR